jgi:hypothetical protein
MFSDVPRTVNQHSTVTVQTVPVLSAHVPMVTASPLTYPLLCIAAAPYVQASCFTRV